MRKKIILLFVGLVALMAGIGLYFTPHIAVYNMKKAAENKDAEALSGYVDYPSLRESLKANFNAMMVGEIAKSKNESPFEAFGAALAAALINPMIDALVTPESLAMLMKGENPQMGDTEKNREIHSSSDEADTETSMSYEGLNQFVVTVKQKGSFENPVKLIYKRHGIFSWKLSALRMPFKEGKTFSAPSLEHVISDSLSDVQKSKKSNKMENPLLIPTLTNKRFQESDFVNGIYEDAIWFDISWDTSPLKKSTRAIKGVLILGDIFGEPKLRLRWTINKPLTPGMSYTEKGVGFEYNQFIDSHKWVREAMGSALDIGHFRLTNYCT